MKKTIKKNKLLVETIVEALHEKKALDVVGIDLTGISGAITDHFIICHGESTTQVQALADGVLKKVREDTKEKAWHVEGTDNSFWILIDYVDVVVHIFQTEYRSFYDIEGLWADADQIKHEDKPVKKK